MVITVEKFKCMKKMKNIVVLILVIESIELFYYRLINFKIKLTHYDLII